MTGRKITAALVALALGAGLGAGCNGDRETEESGNQGLDQQTPAQGGSPVTQSDDTGPGLTSTGKAETQEK